MRGLTGLLSIPNEIGPHEGRELALMLVDSKPLAMFYEVVGYECGEIPEADFQPYVDSGKLIKQEFIFESRKPTPHQSRYVYYAQVNEAARIQRLAAITKEYNETDLKTNDALETEIGQLLGYSDHAIAVYLKHLKRMKPFKKALSIKL